ncbi:MAG: efflux RND transporter periplasmic adaptor subunit [Rhodospirillaceae bacterium]
MMRLVFALALLAAVALPPVACAADPANPHAGHGAITPAPAPASPQAERKILYYRNPMGLADTSPVPKIDSMGMDYIPVYEDEVAGVPVGTVKISPDKVQKLGVRTEMVMERQLARTVRALGTVQPIEQNEVVVAPRFEAWIETLNVHTDGQAVTKGQSLMEVYSPVLVLAQEEYLLAVSGNMPGLAEGALRKLRNLDVSMTEIAALRKRGKASRTISIPSPLTGVVTERKAVKGMRFMAGEELYRLADLSTVWVLADVFEQDVGLITIGQTVRISLNAFPGRTFTGTVSMIHPTMTAENRTVKVHITLPNSEGQLRPLMSATVELAAPVAAALVLAVPDSAVLDSGNRQVVLVERGEGQFEPRPVQLGARADGYAQVLGGVRAGEKVVVRANFLIDAESNLRAALGGFTGK